MGDVPRDFVFDFYDFLDNKVEFLIDLIANCLFIILGE